MPHPTGAADTPPSFAGVFGALSPHMEAFDGFLRAQIAAFEPEIRSAAAYCLDSSGKRIRPALVFFAGWQGHEAVSGDLVRAAAVVEFVHLATLVHDDIMDGAEVRRNRRTADRRYGPAAAVLLGDALFAHALSMAAQFPTTEVCASVSEATRNVCAGEAVQTLRRRATDLTPGDYRRIIELKTAELFRVSCFLGARLAGREPGFVQAAASFGRHLGVAYQIYDDLADFFGEERRLGKTLGTDLASGKMTLPIFALRDRLQPTDQRTLDEEISGERPPELELRLRQMRELGVFAAVAASIEEDLAAADAALQPWPGVAATPLLLGLTEVLRSQVQALEGGDEPRGRLG